jgi:hypothetical protein
VVTLADLDAAGVSRSGVARRVRAGRLHRLHRGVYALMPPPALAREGIWLAAVLAAGSGAALTGLAAAAHWQAYRRPVRAVEVVARGTLRSPRGVRVRECRNLHPRDVTVHRGIPIVTVARMCVDLADTLTAEELANVIHEAAFRGLFSEQAARDALARAHGRHHVSVLAQALDLHAAGSAGSKSANELRFLGLTARAGLPKPLINTHVHGIEVDFHWPDQRLIVEVDGGGHERPRTRVDDAAKTAFLEAHGWTVLRVPEQQLLQAPHEVVARLLGAVRALG